MHNDLQRSEHFDGVGRKRRDQRIRTPLVNCQQPIGTATVVEPDPTSAAAFQSVGLASPTPMLRNMLS